jgi:hypothetical protein
LGILPLAKISKGSIFPKTQKTGHPMGISSLKNSMDNFSSVHAIFAQISLISTACQKKLKNLK